MTKKPARANIKSLLQEKGINASSNTSSNVSKSEIENDADRYIKVDISKIKDQNLARITMREDVISRLVVEFQDIGNSQVPELRKPNPAIDGDDLPPNIEYMVLTGHHRFAAMRRLAEIDPEQYSIWQFRYKPSTLFKSKADVLKHQVSENNTRANMNLAEIGKAVQGCLETGEFKNKGEVAEFLGINSSQVSRGLRCIKYIPESDLPDLLRLGLESEDALLTISKFFERGEDWRALLKAHAINDENEYDESLINSPLLKKILKNLEAQEEEKLNANKSVESAIQNIDDDAEAEKLIGNSAESSSDVVAGLNQTVNPVEAGIRENHSDEVTDSTLIVLEEKQPETSTTEHESFTEQESSTAEQTYELEQSTGSNQAQNLTGSTIPDCFGHDLTSQPTGQKAQLKRDVDAFIRGISIALSSPEIANDLDEFIKNISEESLQQLMEEASSHSIYSNIASKLSN